jgi:hypothetical protein
VEIPECPVKEFAMVNYSRWDDTKNKRREPRTGSTSSPVSPKPSAGI